MIYEFLDNKGTFLVENPHRFSYLYFPLTNKLGTILSSISPNLAGDIKKNNDEFLTIPATVEDIKNNLLVRREFFIKIGESILRLSFPWKKDSLEAGFLYHKLRKKSERLYAEVINFVPFDLDVEVMWIKLKSLVRSVEFTPFFFLPLFGRSEKNLRDHRHVSSLLNRIELTKFGIILKPTMIFDERGHKKNETHYFVLGFQDNRKPFVGQFPTLLSFLGEEGDVYFPQAVYRDTKPYRKNKEEFNGKEVCAGFKFERLKLKKNEEVNYIIIMGICKNKDYIKNILRKLSSPQKVREYLQSTKRFWQSYNSYLEFDFKDNHFNNWLQWVKLQPTLRKLFGCSFLPHFDYGKGGRGWRDLWQDILTLIIKDEEGIENLILHNLKGIRIDGSNATIITKDGEFIPDRNRITRVWTDHGIWPLIAINAYVEKTGDINLLLKEITYFRDNQIKRAREYDYEFLQHDNILKTKDNKNYKGTVIEHLLVENLVQFFNVGKHNFLRLENGDWNDGLDMAPDNGESIPFYCMYAYNLKIISELLKRLMEKGVKNIKVFEELNLLLDSIDRPVDYNSPKEKIKRLEEYLEKTKFKISGRKITLSIKKLISDLDKKSEWITNYVRKKAWLKEGFYNGYYDNRGRKVEGIENGKIRMLLQSQVFPIISGIATDSQIKKIWQSINRYLKDKRLGGFHLNTDFKKLYLDLGRAFGFSYGDKENGAFFNHMVVLLAFGLYKRGYTKEGLEILKSLWKMCTSKNAKMYPMIPEYFNSEGRGLYFYLTGSASWYVYTLFTEVLGIKFQKGNLLIEPKIISDFFFKNNVKVKFKHLKKDIVLLFRIPKKLKGSENLKVEKIYINGEITSSSCKDKVVIEKDKLRGSCKSYFIEIVLNR